MGIRMADNSSIVLEMGDDYEDRNISGTGCGIIVTGINHGCQTTAMEECYQNWFKLTRRNWVWSGSCACKSYLNFPSYYTVIMYRVFSTYLTELNIFSHKWVFKNIFCTKKVYLSMVSKEILLCLRFILKTYTYFKKDNKAILIETRNMKILVKQVKDLILRYWKIISQKYIHCVCLSLQDIR